METIWLVLSERLKIERDLLGSRTDPEHLRRAWAEGRAYGEFEGSRLASFCARWPTADLSWQEIGACWTAPHMRSRGYASRAFAGVWHTAPQGIRFFLITHRHEMVRIVEQHGWKEANAERWTAEVPWAASCGPCDRITEHKERCPYRGRPDQCRLYVSP